METVPFAPSCRALADLVRAVTDDDLARPTPCPAYTVADLVDHIGGLTLAFTAAARKERLEHGSPSGDGSRLEPGFRDRIAVGLDSLAHAWADPAAYDGTTQAGPVELPAPIAARVALNEVVVHAWDLAVATGGAQVVDPEAVALCGEFVGVSEAPEDEVVDGGEVDGLFGPPVTPPAGASDLDRLVARTGRQPGWPVGV